MKGKYMKKVAKILMVSILGLSIQTAFAKNTTIDNYGDGEYIIKEQSNIKPKTRDEVKAELKYHYKEQRFGELS